ncbi:hypothetical protein [Aliiroseovarius sp.]|uniref:hypothetical protein n=1 Tax=Aliiroseovarius sp. TaxID=1872442 RepID=UPI003BA9F94D
MARYRKFTAQITAKLSAALLAVSVVSMSAPGVLAAADVSEACKALQQQVDQGARLSKAAQDQYDECFPIAVGGDAKGVTNIVPGLLPIIAGAGGLAAAAAGLGGAGSTGSTTGAGQ